MTDAAPNNLGLGNLTAVWRLGARGVLILAFLVAGGAFSLQLSGLDPHAPVGADSASARSEIATGVAFVVVGMFGARGWRRIGTLLRANAVLLALPALAILSTLWAPEPAVALRRALAFTATVLCGFALVACLPGASALRFLGQVAAAGVVASLAYILICPTYGLHQITDGVQSLHAGDWRGLFIHRTALGQLAALCLTMSLYGGTSHGRPLVRVGVISVSILCLMGARSGGGWVSAMILSAAPWGLKAGRWVIVRGRLIGTSAALGAMVLALLLAPFVASLALQILGKDATLTGRTDLWRLMLHAAAERPMLGYGYSTGFRDLVARLVAAQSRFGYVPNAQNGYLDVVLNLGLVGLALTLVSLGLAFWRGLQLSLGPGERSGLTLLPLLIFVFIAEMNVVEAATISANDIFVLIYTAAFVASGDLVGMRRGVSLNDAAPLAGRAGFQTAHRPPGPDWRA